MTCTNTYIPDYTVYTCTCTYLVSVGDIDVSRLGNHVDILLVSHINDRKGILVEAEANLVTRVSSVKHHTTCSVCFNRKHVSTCE